MSGPLSVTGYPSTKGGSGLGEGDEAPLLPTLGYVSPASAAKKAAQAARGERSLTLPPFRDFRNPHFRSPSTVGNP